MWFPVGHPRRRREAQPHVRVKLCRGIQAALPAADEAALSALLLDLDRLRRLPVSTLVDALLP